MLVPVYVDDYRGYLRSIQTLCTCLRGSIPGIEWKKHNEDWMGETELHHEELNFLTHTINDGVGCSSAKVHKLPST